MSPSTPKDDNIVQIETQGEDPIKLNVYKGDVVVSGIGGRFPESDDTEEFKKNLYAGVDMVTMDGKHWPAGILGIPPRSGKLKHPDLFDASFFGISEKQADATDPQFRIILETAYEAIVDAGVNPQTLRGTNTGVFVACAINEAEICRTHDPSEFSKFSILTYCRSLMPNFISFAFDLRGPSYLVDSACASSYFAIHQALTSIRMGQCDAAIVAGSNIILRPNTTLALQKLGVLSPRGKSCSFDASADGYVRSEAVVAIFIQKSTDARRVYATLVNAKVNIDGSKVKGIVFPSRQAQKKLFEDVYTEANVRLQDVAYVECHATGTRVGDTEEGNAVAAAFCKDRDSPLLVASTRTNIGHSEAVSGLSSLVKIIFSLETGFIPPCLHFQSPSPRIEALNDGRMKVITEITPMSSPYVSANSFGLGGTNGHLLIKANSKKKEPMKIDSVPRLVCVSGRTEAAVEHMLEKIILQPQDDEFNALIHKIHEFNIPQHNYRGFALLNDSRPWKEIQEMNPKPRPIWYAFSGIGSQWVGIGRDLMKFGIFRELTNKVAQILKREDFDLIQILTSTDESIMDNILNSVVSITTIQVILVDLLRLLSIVPDGIIGHSLGEIGCAYADNALTLEEAILTSYWRGKCLLDSKLPKKAMAAVGLSWEEVRKQAPKGIEIACHNYSDITTISGPCDLIDEFVNRLNKNKIFGRLIPSAGFAFHSSYIADVGPIFLKNIEKIIRNPKPRSDKWLSTSVPLEQWDSPNAQYSSAAYHLNNFLSPVLFYEALKMIPPNAIVIEIGPHALLQSIIKKVLTSDGTSLGLLDKYQPDSLEFFLKNIGRLYNEGAQPNIQNIFPPIQFPVSKGTPMIQPLIRWDHSVSYEVPHFTDPSGCYLHDNTILKINPSNAEHTFYLNHSIGGRIIFPASGYIYIIWQMFAKFYGKSVDVFPVVIEKIQFLRTTLIQPDDTIKFSITILLESGSFEIMESGSLVVKGYINKPDNIQNQFLPLPNLSMVSNYQLNTAEIYSEFNLRGYNYTGEFCGIKSSDDYGTYGEVYATDNFITFIDAMLQFIIFGTTKKRVLKFPSQLQRIVIDPHKNIELRKSMTENSEFLPICHYKDIQVVYCGGIEITGLQTKLATHHQLEKATPLIMKYSFLPFEIDQDILGLDFDHVLTIIFNIVMENHTSSNESKIVVIHESNSINNSLAEKFAEIIKLETTAEVKFIVSSSLPGFSKYCNQFGAQLNTNNISSGPVDIDCNLIVIKNAIKNSTKMKNLVHSISNGGFILSIEDTLSKSSLEYSGLKRIMKLNVGGQFLLLFKKANSTLPRKVISVGKTSNQSDKWVDEIQHTNEDVKTLILSQEQNRAIVELIKTTNRNTLRSLFILDKEICDNFLESPIVMEQLKNDLIQNVFKDSLWGSYQYLKIHKQSDLQLSTHAYVKSFIPGDISGLQWVNEPAAEESYSGSKICYVYYTSLNTRDLFMVHGEGSTRGYLMPNQPKDKVLGLEFSGRDENGRRVMGIAEGCLSTIIQPEINFLWDVPQKWTLEEASSIPLSYASAYYGLFLRGNLREGESILIHNGGQCVCQAAISIALYAGCKVYATVNSEKVESILQKKFPNVTTINYENMHDSLLERELFKLTNERGVHLIFNHKTTDKLSSIGRCLRKNGRFVQMSSLVNENLQAVKFPVEILKNASLHMINFHMIMTDKENLDKMNIIELVNNGIMNGAVVPLDREIYGEENLQDAFKLLFDCDKTSKITIKIRDEEPQSITKPSPRFLKTNASVHLHPAKTYILIGDFDRIAVEMVYWLISRGAMKIVFATHEKIDNGYRSFHIQQWIENRVDILFLDYDCTTEFGTNNLLQKANTLGPVGGIFHLEHISQNYHPDVLSENLPSITALENLDSISRTSCLDLDYFVVFSSNTTTQRKIKTIPFDFSYAAAERICENRQTEGFRSVAIQWEDLRTMPLTRLVSYLSLLDQFLQYSDPILIVSTTNESNIENEIIEPKIEMMRLLKNTLGVEVNDNLMNCTLPEVGLDSLMSVELQGIFQKKFGITLTPTDTQEMTIGRLIELLPKKS